MNDIVDKLWLFVNGTWSFESNMVRKSNDRFGFEVARKVWLVMKNSEDVSSLKMSGLKRRAEFGPARPSCVKTCENEDLEAQNKSGVDQIVSDLEDCKLVSPGTVDEVLGSLKKLKLCEKNAFGFIKVENKAKIGENSTQKPVFDRMNPPQTPGKCKHLTGNQTLGGLNDQNQVREAKNSTAAMRNPSFAENDQFRQIQPVLLNSMCKSSTEQALNKTRATEGVSVDVSESTLNVADLGKSGLNLDSAGYENLAIDQSKPPLKCEGKMDKYSGDSTSLSEKSQEFLA